MNGLNEQERDLQEHEVNLRNLWRDLAESGVELGVDWPYIVLTLFRDIDRLAARTEQARPEHVVAAEALREAGAVLNDWPESATIDCSYRAADYCGEFAEWLRDRADALEVQR